MASRHKIEVTLLSTKDSKMSTGAMAQTAHTQSFGSTRVDEEGDMSPVPPAPVEDQTLYIDIIHAGCEKDTKPLIGFARLRVNKVLNDVGFNEYATRSLQPKPPFCRAQWKLDVRVSITEPSYHLRNAYYAPSYGTPYAAPPPPGSRYYPPYRAPYSGPSPPNPYYATTPLLVVTHTRLLHCKRTDNHVTSTYTGRRRKKKSKFGGTGTAVAVAVGTIAGILDRVALAKGVNALEDHIANEATKKVDDDLGYDGDDF